MRPIRIRYTINRNKLPHRKKEVSSKSIDRNLLFSFVIMNELNLRDNKNKLFSCENGINYFSITYVRLLRNNIVKMYEKSEDPVEKGDLQASNLEFCLDYVKSIYNDVKPRRRQIWYKSAFLLYHLNIKHPFFDGNKRTSIVTCNSFLEYNGFMLLMPFRKSNEFIIELAKGNRSEVDCRHFITKYVHPLRVHKSSKKIMLKIAKEVNKLKESKKN